MPACVRTLSSTSFKKMDKTEWDIITRLELIMKYCGKISKCVLIFNSIVLQLQLIVCIIIL